MIPVFDPITGTLVGHEHEEINSLSERLANIAKTRAIISINFYDNLTEVNWHNLTGGDVVLKSFATTNIKTVYISDGISMVRQNLATLVASGTATIAKNATLTIEIEKTTDAPAALTIAFE